MVDRVSRALAVANTVVRTVFAEQVTFLAAGIAYYAFVSMVPLLVLVIAVTSLFGGDRMAELAIQVVEGFLTPDAQELLRDALIDGSGRAGATTASLVVFIWSGLRLFRGLDVAFARIYGVDRGTISDHLSDVFTVFFAVTAGITAIAIFGTLGIVIPGTVPFQGALSAGAMVVALVVVLFPIYFVFPNVEMDVRDALPGTVLAAVGWTILASLFGAYASIAMAYTIYGVLGGILLLVTLFYLGAILVMVGAVFNVVIAGYPLDDPEPPADIAARE